MNIDLIWLAFSSLFAFYSLYTWRKYSDQQSLLLAILSTLAVFLVTAKLFLVALFPENIKKIINILIWISWVPILYFLIVIAIKTSRYGKLYEESKRDIDVLVIEIVSNWNSDKLIEVANSELFDVSSKEDIKEGFSRFADQFGVLKKYIGSKGKVAIPFHPFRNATVKHVAEIVFEKGNAKIFVERVKESSQWKIRSFYIKPVV